MPFGFPFCYLNMFEITLSVNTINLRKSKIDFLEQKIERYEKMLIL